MGKMKEFSREFEEMGLEDELEEYLSSLDEEISSEDRLGLMIKMMAEAKDREAGYYEPDFSSPELDFEFETQWNQEIGKQQNRASR